MILPKEKRGIKNKSPNMLTLFGASKIGKTTELTKLKDCLLIDSERGANKLSGFIAEVNNLNELRELVEELKKENPYKYLALDTIDSIVTWVEEDVVYNYNLKDPKIKISSVGEMPFGSGYDQVRIKTFKILNSFKSLGKLIVIGHRKRTIIGAEKVEIKVDSLDLTGKLKGMIMADSDAIGYVFRDKEGLKISFKGDDSLETGSRCEHLINKIIDFDWDKIYID